MLVNKNTFNLKTKLATDWGQHHKIVLDLEALTNAKNWKIGISLADSYQIEQIYGAKLSTKNGQTYISGLADNKKMKAGEKAEIVLIVNEGNNHNKKAILPEFFFADSNSKSTVKGSSNTNFALTSSSEIVEDWNGGYKLELDLKAKSKVKNWQLDFSLPYEIREVYGVDLIDHDNGNYTIKGQDNWINLKKGQSIKPIFIIDDGGKPAKELDITDNSSAVESEPILKKKPVKQESPKITASGEIVEDWNGGYKLEIDLEAKSKVKNWQLDFNLPYEIREVYGVDLIDHDNGNYTIKGQDNWINLKKGQSIKPIFIIDDGGQTALTPEFADSAITNSSKPSKAAKTKSTATPDTSQDNAIEIPDTPTQLAKQARTEQKGKFAYGEALQKNFLFFEANRSGDLGPDNRVEWRSDSTLNDGSDVGRDLEGGYFDAGDHIKFVQPMTWSNTMLAWGGIDYKEAYQRTGQMDELLKAVKWGTDYFLKTHETDSSGKTKRLWVQVGDKSDHYHWVAPEQIDKVTKRSSYYIDATRPGSDAAAGTASALASASMLFRGVDDAYANKLLKNAVALFDFAETYKGKYSDSVPEANPMYTSWSGYWDELAAGSAWLYKATKDAKYLSKAENYFKNNVGGLGDWTYAADDRSYGAAMILATESSDPFFKGQVKNWIDTWVQGKGNVNYTPGGFAHRAQWASVPLNMSTAFAAEWYNDFVEPNQGFSDFANRQVDYVLGDNPADLSYVIGFGDKYPLRPHHRGSSGTASGNEPNEHILYGAVVGGPSEVDDFSHDDRRGDWVTNEVGTGYNAPFASAAIAQYDNLGGDPLSDAELDQLIGIDANGVGF